jgi:hypothetical protein
MKKNLESETNNVYNKLDNPQTENSPAIELKEPNPPFFKIVDYLFAKATKEKYAPPAYENKSKLKPAVTAALLGGGIAAAGTGAIDIGVRVLNPEFHAYMFHLFQGLGALALTGGIIYYSDQFKKWAKEHPVYLAGMSAVAAACYATTLVDMLIK